MGFKILPETVCAVLLTHLAVRDACVVGVPDRRLGQVPFAGVEPRRGAAAPSETELKELVPDSLYRLLEADASVAKSTVAKFTVASAANWLSGIPITSTWTTTDRRPACTTLLTARAVPPAMGRK